MVQHYVSPVYVYKYPFEMVMAAYIRRFPRTEHIPILADTEIVEEETSEDGMEIRTKRRCKLVVEAPYLIKRIAGVDFCYFFQENVLNWKDRTLHICAYNETFSSRVQVKETCLYTVHSENENWTCYDQEATIEFINFFGFENQCEKLGLEKYTQQIRSGKGVMDKFIQDLLASGDPIPNPYADYQLMLEQQQQQHLLITNSGVCRAGDTHLSKSATATAQRDETIPIYSDLAQNNLVAADKSSPGTMSAVSTCDSAAYTTVSAATPVSTTSAANPPPVCSAALPDTSCVSVSSDVTATRPSASAGATGASSADGVTQVKGRICHRSSKSLDTFKLNAEYIQRFLGELTPIQESNLIQLRSLISASRFADKMPNDAVLLRFLRAREFNIEKARDMICHHLGWRKQYQVDQIIQSWVQPEVLRLYYPGGWHYSDKDGHPVFMLRLGQVDVQGLFESVGEAAITKQLLVFEEEGLKHCEAATKMCDKAIGTVTLVCDLEGLSMRHFWRPGINCFDRLLQLFQNNYPETMGKLLFVRAPRIFPLLWALVFPFIDERTREKVFVSAGNDYLDPEEGLSNFLPQEYIPDFLGGSCRCSFSEGGMVPKKLFADSPFSLDSQQKSCALETLYTTVDIGFSRSHEVLVEAASQSVIMWDFDVVRGSVTFSILHLSDKPVSQTTTTT
eukprot:scpid56684/ scgid3090/ SEC14-like protein 1